jgi:hypothetical protein
MNDFDFVDLTGIEFEGLQAMIKCNDHAIVIDEVYWILCTLDVFFKLLFSES